MVQDARKSRRPVFSRHQYRQAGPIAIAPLAGFLKSLLHCKMRSFENW
jgi:hypothetical protein